MNNSVNDVFIELTGDYNPAKKVKTNHRVHYITLTEFLETYDNLNDPILNPFTLKHGLYIESFGNFSFLPVHCSIYMQDIFIRIGAYEQGPSVFTDNKWIFTLAGLVFPETTNVPHLKYDIDNIYRYYLELIRIKQHGWKNWVLMVKSCIEQIEDYKGIY